MNQLLVPEIQPSGAMLQRYLLRCRFDYSDRPKPWVSMWNKAGGCDATKAFVNARQQYLLMATIEAKDIETRKIVPLAACEGKDFLSFEWMASVRVPAGFTGKRTGTIVGLSLVTHEATVRVTMDGRIKVDRTPPSGTGMHYSDLGV